MTPRHDQPSSPSPALNADHLLEQEYARIARDLHDELGGDFVAINMAVAQLRATLASGNASQQACDVIEARVKAALDSMHRLIDDLRPAILDFGIVAALRWRADQFTRVTGVPCSFASEGEQLEEIEAIDMAPQRAASLLRIYGEALTNVARHADAGSVQTRLQSHADCLELTVQDDGVGLQAQAEDAVTHGLRNMQQRAQALGGELSFAPAQDRGGDGEAGRGTRLTLRIPHG